LDGRLIVRRSYTQGHAKMSFSNLSFLVKFPRQTILLNSRLTTILLTTVLPPSVDGYKGGYRLGPAQYFAVIVSVSPTDE